MKKFNRDYIDKDVVLNSPSYYWEYLTSTWSGRNPPGLNTYEEVHAYNRLMIPYLFNELNIKNLIISEKNWITFVRDNHADVTFNGMSLKEIMGLIDLNLATNIVWIRKKPGEA